MYQPPPTYNGFDPIADPVEQFIQHLMRYFALQGIEKIRWAIILDTLIEDPALTLYNQALNTPFVNGGIRDDIGALADAALIRELEARYDARVAWLRATYNGQNQQEIIKDLLTGMYQGIKEDPKTFYLRITVQARRAGYAGAVMDVMVKQTFMNGIHRDIANKIAEQPRLDLAPTVELATRIWNHAHKNVNQNMTLFPQQVIEQNNSYVPQTEAPKTILTRDRTIIPRQNYEGYRRDEMTTQPRQRKDEKKYNDDLDDIIGRMQKLEAHLMQNQRQRTPERRINFRDERRSLPTQRQEFTRREDGR